MGGRWLGCAALAAWLMVGCGEGRDAQAGSAELLEETTRREPGDIEAQWKDDEREVYDENFGRGAGPEWSQRRVSRTPKGGRQFLGPFNQQEVTLSLDDLPAHDEVEVSLDLFVLKTWDGNDTTAGPDRWVASVDGGRVLLDATFSNDKAPFEPRFFQSYPDAYPEGSHPGLTGAQEKGTLGYPDESGYGGVGDSIYRLTFTFRHTGSELVLRFADPPRGDANEEWGVDSVSVKVRKKQGRDLLVSEGASGRVLRFDGETGEFVGNFVEPGSGGLANPQELVYGPDGNLYIASFDTRNVLRFNGKTGAFIDVFVPAGSGGLGATNAIAFGPDGNLYVSDAYFGTFSVLRYDGRTGAFLGVFATGGGLVSPYRLAFDKRGDLLVVNGFGNNVLRYDGDTGAPLPAPGQSGAVFIPNLVAYTLAVGKDGKVYIGTPDSAVLRFDGRTGAFIDVFVTPGSGGLTESYDLEFGPDGNLYLPTYAPGTVRRYSGRTGAFIDTFVPPGTAGLGATITLTFMPSKRSRSHALEPATDEAH